MFKNFTKYEVYSDGRIYSYKRNKFLKPTTDKKGYQRVQLYDNDGKMKSYLVHRIVYESVTSEPIPKGMQVNHLNEIKTDCRFANLNLLTPKENTNFGTGNERRSKANTNGKCSKQVGAFQNGELIMIFPSTNEAQRQGFDQSAVSKCCRNCFNREGNNIYKGFEWKYI